MSRTVLGCPGYMEIQKHHTVPSEAYLNLIWSSFSLGIIIILMLTFTAFSASSRIQNPCRHVLMMHTADSNSHPNVTASPTSCALYERCFSFRCFPKKSRSCLMKVQTSQKSPEGKIASSSLMVYLSRKIYTVSLPFFLQVDIWFWLKATEFWWS